MDSNEFNTTHRLLIVYSDLFLQKKCIFSSYKKFSISCGPFYLLNSWPLWPVFDKNFVCFSNTLSMFKVMLCNSNLPKFDMLTLSSSNMTAPTLKTNEHLKRRTNHVFYLHFANSNLKVIFSHFILNIKKKLFHIWNLHKMCVFSNIFIQS